MRILCPILEQYGVDVVFNSHTIVYERSHPLRNNGLDLMKGIVYIVAGGAGACPQWFHHTRAWHTGACGRRTSYGAGFHSRHSSGNACDRL